MKQLISMLAAIVLIVSLAVSAFTYAQVQKEEAMLHEDLERRTALLADSFMESIRPSYLTNATKTLQSLLNRFAGRERLLGLAVYDNKSSLFLTSEGITNEIISGSSVIEQAMDSNSASGGFLETGENQIYVYASPLHDEEKIIGAVAVYQRADYINAAIMEIWKTNFMRLLIQALLFSIAVVLMLRWIIYRPIVKMAEAIRKARAGKLEEDSEALAGSGFFKPIAAELSKMTKSLAIARTSASQEARLRLQKIDSPWTSERLKEFFKAYLKDRQIFVVSNREPYIHEKVRGEVKFHTVPASGMVTALEPVMEACGGLWLAHGSGDADKETADKEGKISVPPDEPKYTLKRVWLSEKEVNGYYNGFCNEALWPLCHLSHTRPIFRKEDWAEYRKVNGKFAQNLLAEIKDVHRPLVLIQDYHFALLPAMIKKARPDAEVGLFWHIPWPNEEAFSICPWRKEILEGMLGADVIGFHTQQHCNNFLETVGKEVESLTDLEKFAITHKGHTAYIKPFPISVAFTDGGADTAASSPLLEELGIKTKHLGLGIDRMDYTKGILERLRGVEFFLDMYPAYKEQFTFLQIASPSREGVEKYRLFAEEVSREAERINDKFKSGSWQPIVLLNEHHTREEIYPLYRAANVCLVTSLSDGMNLVAKEFVAARDDEAGVLILSKFTGAARDLKDALIINPYSAEETADAIYRSLIMPESEQRRRMKKMREAVKNYNVYRWAAEFIKAVSGLA